MWRRVLCGVALGVAALLMAGHHDAAGQVDPALAPPYTLEALLIMLERLDEGRVVQLASDNCLRFELDASSRVALTRAGASDDLIRSLDAACFVDPDPDPVPREPVGSVVVSPARTVLEVGEQARLSARTLAGSGAVLAGRQVRWSADGGAVRVATDGTVQARGDGLIVVSAESEGQIGRAQVRVLPGFRSPGGAFATGVVVPGGGQFSVGRPVRGTLTLLGTAGAVAWGVLTTETQQFCASPVGAGGTCQPEDVLRESVERPNLIPGIAGGVSLMLLSALDAALHARSHNREAERVRADPWRGVAPAVGVGADGVVHAAWRLNLR